MHTWSISLTLLVDPTGYILVYSTVVCFFCADWAEGPHHGSWYHSTRAFLYLPQILAVRLRLWVTVCPWDVLLFAFYLRILSHVTRKYFISFEIVISIDLNTLHSLVLMTPSFLRFIMLYELVFTSFYLSLVGIQFGSWQVWY